MFTKTAMRVVLIGLGSLLVIGVSSPALGGDSLPRAIFRANADGTDIEQVVPSDVADAWFHLAVNEQYVFWKGHLGDFGGFDIQRADLDGQNVETIGGDGGGGLAVDSEKQADYVP